MKMRRKISKHEDNEDAGRRSYLNLLNIIVGAILLVILVGAVWGLVALWVLLQRSG